MLKIDPDKMIIYITRGDTATIVFSAVDENGATYTPTYTSGVADSLRFAVAKKTGADPLIEITNTYNGNASTFWAIAIGADDWINNGSKIKSGEYVFDVQLTHGGEVDTIIGATDTVKPKFVVWGDVARE